MGIAFLKMDRSRVKWRIKLSEAFDDRIGGALRQPGADAETGEKSRWWKRGGREPKRARGGKWALFLLPFITVLREGLEAVVFVGGVSNGPSDAAACPDITLVLSRSPWGSLLLPFLSPSSSVSSPAASLAI